MKLCSLNYPENSVVWGDRFKLYFHVRDTCKDVLVAMDTYQIHVIESYRLVGPEVTLAWKPAQVGFAWVQEP